MIFKVFSVRDAAAQAFLPPFVVPRTAQAVRSFTQAINDPKHDWYRSPGDYDLHELGEFDDETGAVISNPVTPIVVKGLFAHEPSNQTEMDGL